ncbi:MAG: thiamine pyrophosphate-binding protein [Marinibacterium sp.]|nr:thiamine pyrophosphate-binding protein [Marinibacterium sp.]
MPDQITVHAALARALKDQGVDTLFGLMGDSNLFMVDHYVRQLGGRYVPAVHEAGAVLMALGYATATGRIAAATVTQGPAVSNTVTSLIEGVKGMTPMVLLAGDTPVQDPDHPQAVAQKALIEAAGAGFEQLRSPETVAVDVANAFRRARLERRPVVLNMPTPFMWEQTSYDPVPFEDHGQPAAPGEGDALNNAIGAIAAARRPLVLAGRGAVHARDQLLALADRIGAPVATTLKAKSLFHGAPYDLDVFGTLSTPAAGDVIAKADCIIAFGAGLNRFTTVKGGFLEGKRLIQVDDDIQQLGRRYNPDAAIAGDPGLVADTFVHWLDEAEIPSSQSTDTINPDDLRAEVPVPPPGNAPGTVDLARAMVRLDAALPEDRVLVCDGGRFMQTAWERIGVNSPENFVVSTNVGAIGMGMGYAVGAAVARPDQKTLFLCGDGGFMMGGLSEFSATLRENLNMVTVICNDSAYGAEYIQFEDRQMDPSLSEFTWPSMAAMAEAMGAKGIKVSSEVELDHALETMMSTDGPVLIELVLDPASVPRIHL